MLNRYSRFDNIWSNLTMIGYLVESNADTGMRNCWINGVHHQGITTLRITFKEHLPTLWFKPIERRFRAEQKAISSWTKDAFELNKDASKQIKGRFPSRSKDDCKLIIDDCKLIKRTITSRCQSRGEQKRKWYVTRSYNVCIDCKPWLT